MPLFGSSPANPPGFFFREQPIGGISAVYELDLLVLLMTVLSCWHAYKHKQMPLALAGFGLGLVTEHASLRFGGTHCHQSGIINFSQCSSVNACVYYLPWVYACVTLSRRLVDETSWSYPLICGLFFFGMCGVYESQGPMMGWWLWPQTDLTVKANCDVRQFGKPALDPNNLIATQHAYDALYTRVFGVPALAPYFHFAFGWGIAYAFQGLKFDGGYTTALLCVLGGPAIAMIWDPPIRILGVLLGADQASAAMCLMALALALPFFLGVPLHSKPQKPDYLLFAIPLLNEAFFLHNAAFGRGADVLPPPLKLFVLTTGIAATCAYGRAAGVLTAASSSFPSPPKGGGAKASHGGAPSSWLDRLQKDAHASEMDYSNTSPYFFLFLTIIQPFVASHLADIINVPRSLALLPIASHTVMFLVSHYLIKTDRFFDITGEATFLPLILYSHSLVDAPSPRQTLLTGLACLWCARLGLFLGIRIFVRGSDWRFVKLMHGQAYNLFGWVCQGSWIFLQGVCLWVCHQSTTESNTPLNSIDYLGALVMLLGLAIEHVADMQKSKWNSQFKSGMQKAWLQTGLWKYSRHPNYFGENLLWVGLAMIAANGAATWSAMAIAFVSPVWSAFFLLFTSLMLLEKRLDKKFGGMKAYEQYKASTSVLVLWPPK